VASLSQGRTAAAQCGLFTYKSVPVIFEPPCIINTPVRSTFLYKMLQRTLDYVCVRCFTPQTFRLINNAAIFDKINTVKTVLTD